MSTPQYLSSSDYNNYHNNYSGNSSEASHSVSLREVVQGEEALAAAGIALQEAIYGVGSASSANVSLEFLPPEFVALLQRYCAPVAVLCCCESVS